MSSTGEVASQLVEEWVANGYNQPNHLHPLIDKVDAALRQQEAEHQAVLIRRDGFMCEAHPGLEFEHDTGCAGPGMPWVIEGKDAITDALRQREQEVRAEERNVLACTVKAMRDEWETKRNGSEPLSKLRNRYDAGFCAANEILAAIRRDDTPQKGERP
jgi:hypothetical protein